MPQSISTTSYGNCYVKSKQKSKPFCRALGEQVAAVQFDLEHLLAVVTTLDLATARARYGFWLGGNAPGLLIGQQVSLSGSGNCAIPY